MRTTTPQHSRRLRLAAATTVRTAVDACPALRRDHSSTGASAPRRWGVGAPARWRVGAPAPRRLPLPDPAAWWARRVGAPAPRRVGAPAPRRVGAGAPGRWGVTRASAPRRLPLPDRRTRPPGGPGASAPRRWGAGAPAPRRPGALAPAPFGSSCRNGGGAWGGVGGIKSLHDKPNGCGCARAAMIGAITQKLRRNYADYAQITHKLR